MKSLSLFACTFILSACSSLSTDTPLPPNSVVAVALSGESVLGHKVGAGDLPNLDLFGLTDEMKMFAKSAVSEAKHQDEKVEMLHKALLTRENGGRGIRYSLLSTGTAAEVFATRETNCLGYSLLFVAMARYVGLNANLNQVMIPPYWYMDEGLANTDRFFRMKHVNARIKLRKPQSFQVSALGVPMKTSARSDIIIDLEMRRFRSAYPQVLLKDAEVSALFYNNRAMELLEEEKVADAFLYLKKALSFQIDANFIWTNLGTLYRRQGQMELAEAVYLKALSIDSSDLTVLNNLAGIYKQMGRLGEAETYQARVKKYRESNPYYLYQMAIRSKETGEWDKAREWIQKALSKQKNEVRFYRLAAEIYEHQGLHNQAKKMHIKAEVLAGQDSSQLQAAR